MPPGGGMGWRLGTASRGGPDREGLADKSGLSPLTEPGRLCQRGATENLAFWRSWPTKGLLCFPGPRASGHRVGGADQGSWGDGEGGRPGQAGGVRLKDVGSLGAGGEGEAHRGQLASLFSEKPLHSDFCTKKQLFQT